MSYKPRINIIYLVIVVAVFFYVYKTIGNDIQQLILTFAAIDIFIAFFAIVKGIVKREMASIIVGCICGIIAFGTTKNINYTSLLFQILGGIIGTGAVITKNISRIFK